MLKRVALYDEKLIPAWLQPAVALDLLTARGVNLSSALSGTSIFVEDLPFTGHYLSGKQFDRLLENANREWPTKDFAFLLGHQIARGGLGPLADVIRESACVKELIEALDRFSILLAPSIIQRSYRVNEEEYFLLMGPSNYGTVSSVAQKCFISALVKSLEFSPLKLEVSVYLRHAEEELENFNAYVNANCYFSAPVDAVRIRLSCDSDPVLSQPSIQQQVAVRQCENICGEREYLLSCVSNMIWRGHADFLDQATSADYLKISPATLKRRLKEVGISYQKFIDQIRTERAVIELLVSGASVEQIGEKLNFHDSSNFRRAFKRWTGMTPRDFRLAYQNAM